MNGWTIFNSERDLAIYISDAGDIQLSFDGQETWETVGKLTNPAKTTRLLLDMLESERKPLDA